MQTSSMSRYNAMSERRAFYSYVSFADAEQKANAAQFTPVQRIYNAKKRQFVVFARKAVGF